MPGTRKTQKTPKKRVRKGDEKDLTRGASEQKQQLKELDNFIEKVLQEAGEEFLDEFKQVEGE